MDSQQLQTLKNKFDIIGNDAALNSALEMAVAIADTNITVLVSGESGVGKENIPKIIHQYSRRRNAKYFAVNCGAIPEGTIDSELFGHEKGSFTGATEARKGYFEEANGGTLFLDEIGELPLPSQAKLLRVLQSGEYIRVGSSKVSLTDVRIVAATNVDLMHAVSQHKFREDLYYRLTAVQIRMPSLRERKDDIYTLFRKFAADFSEQNGRKKVSLTRDAITLLINYRWPGNIRQLKNVAEAVSAVESSRISPISQKCEVDAATLSNYIPKDDDNMLPTVVPGGGGSSIGEEDKRKIFEAIYALKKEVDELKDSIAKGQSGPPAWHDATPSLPENKDYPPVSPSWTSSPSHSPSVQGTPSSQESEVDDQTGDLRDTDDQKHYEKEPEESLSIRGLSEDLIRRALEKHEGNRKKAAKELGISERTLYRKLPPEFRHSGSK